MNSSDLPDIFLRKHQCLLPTLYKSTQYRRGRRKKVKSNTSVTSKVRRKTKITRDMEKLTKIQLKPSIAYNTKLKNGYYHTGHQEYKGH